ncbi:MAG TPA: DUF6252 family protein [Puia sp.]|nr:DUF6252 family protein [Puia sp.]
MKSRFASYILIPLLISFISCTKELSQENGGIKQILNGDFYATIDGNQWNADSLQLISVSNNGVTISGLGKDSEQITILIPTFQTGTYNLNATSASIAIYSNAQSKTYLSNTSLANGTVNISNIDTVKHQVSGTFSFTLIDPTDNSQKSITSGVFNAVPYSGNTGGGTGTLKDTLQANVGGFPFNSVQVIKGTTNGELFVAGISADGNEELALGMPSNVVPGSYNMDFATGMYYGAYYIGINETLLSQMNGTLTIIANDTVARRMSGTFSFIANSLSLNSPVTISAGYFSLSY